MLLKPCARCKKLIPYGLSHCQTCRPIVEQQQEKRRQEAAKKANRKYNKTRDPKYIRFYNSSPWKALAARYSQDKNYHCEDCGKIATQVHHKIAIQTDQGWNLRLDYNNLELLCLDCHNKHHKRFQKRERKH